MAVITLYSVAIFISGFQLIFCAIWFPFRPNQNTNEATSNKLSPEIQELRRNMLEFLSPGNFKASSSQENFPITPINEEQKPNNSSWRDFSSQISNLIPSEIFIQNDPALYLLENIVKLSYDEILKMDFDLRYLLSDENQLPKRYVPYAKVLSKLLNCLYSIRGVTIFIKNIPSTSLTEYSTPPPANLFTRKFAQFRQLFSYDIFSDDKAPFRLMVEFMKTKMEKITDMKMQFDKLARGNRLPKQYLEYVQQMRWFLENESALQELLQSMQELNNRISFAGSQDATKPSKPTVGVPLF